MSFKSKYFQLSEFRCPCGKCAVREPHPELVMLLDHMRVWMGEPIVLNSGVRCAEYNSTLPGSVDGSAHVSGEAVDIRVPDSTYRQKLIRAVLNWPTLTNRFGIGKTFIHVDISKKLDQHVTWLYS